MTPDSLDDDGTLVAAAIAGSIGAFEEIVRRHQDRIFNLLVRLAGDRERAADLAQETFLKAWRGLSGFEGKCSLFTWLYRIARNVVISTQRYDAVRPRVQASLDVDPRDGGAETPSVGGGPSELALVEERRRLVLDAIERLPIDFKEVVVLRDMEDRSYEEIAVILDLPVGTVRSRLHRARSELRLRLHAFLKAAP